MFVNEPTHGNPWQRQTTVEFSSEASTVVTWESGTRDSNDQFYGGSVALCVGLFVL